MSRGLRQLLLFALACPGAPPACTLRPCNPSITAGGGYQVDLIDVYDAKSRFYFRSGVSGSYYGSMGSCVGVDGLAPNLSLRFEAKGETSNPNHNCNYVVADLSNPPAGLTIVGPGTDPIGLSQSNGNEGLFVLADVTTAQCAGTLLLKLTDGGATGGVYSTPVDGMYPAALLYRLFLPSRGPCKPCQDTFSAQVTKI
jgi:hypothetical protein